MASADRLLEPGTYTLIPARTIVIELNEYNNNNNNLYLASGKKRPTRNVYVTHIRLIEFKSSAAFNWTAYWRTHGY